MPLLTSIPWGLRVERASQAFSGFIPPAKSHPCLLLIFGSLNWLQSNPLPLQAFQSEVNQNKFIWYYTFKLSFRQLLIWIDTHKRRRCLRIKFPYLPPFALSTRTQSTREHCSAEIWLRRVPSSLAWRTYIIRWSWANTGKAAREPSPWSCRTSKALQVFVTYNAACAS